MLGHFRCLVTVYSCFVIYHICAKAQISVSLICGCRSMITECKTLQHLSLSSNPKLGANDLRRLLISSSVDTTCQLTRIEFCGCGLVSPITADVFDALVRKLDHATPLTKLRLSCQKLSEADAASLRAVWTAQWQRRSSIVIGRETVTLSVNDENT